MTDTIATTLRRLRLAEASPEERRALTDRASTATPEVRAKARAIVDAIRDGGDAADARREAAPGPSFRRLDSSGIGGRQARGGHQTCRHLDAIPQLRRCCGHNV